MGRRKIEIQPLTDDRNRTVTFVKRKAGLFKKAHELSVLCQVDLAVIIIGNNNKLYEFSSVDTKELIGAYQNIKKPHELKSPANYGSYKKKKHLSDHVNNTMIDDISVDENGDSDYESDSPEPKRPKRSYETMKNPIYQTREQLSASNSHSRDNSQSGANHRPVLRVQIPVDAKSNSKDHNQDSAKTITAIETSKGGTSKNGDKKTNESQLSSSDLNPNSSADYSNNNSNSSNQQSNQNSSSNAPNIYTPKYSSFSTFRSPDSRKPITQLPLPIQNKSQTSSPSSATAPPLPSGMTSFFGSLPQPSPSGQFPPLNPISGNPSNNSNPAVVPTPSLNQVLTQQYNQQNEENGNQQSAKFKPPYFNNPQFQMKEEQTPISGLPSRYVSDMFPSPSNFYVPQEWPTGMTPINSNAPQYFMNMLPNNGNQQPPDNKNQNQMGSPVQYMGPFNSYNVNDKKFNK